MEPEDHQIDFECDRIAEADLPSGAPVITIDPYVPSRYAADSPDVVGAFGTMTLFHLLGERTPEYFTAERIADAAIADRWPDVRRLFEYYLSESWVTFDRIGPRIFNEWPKVSSVHERTTLASQALLDFSARVTGGLGEPAERYLFRFHQKHDASLSNPSYLAWLGVDRDSGRIAGLQRAIFDLVELFISQYESWEVGRLVRWIQSDTALGDMTLFRDEFPIVRDLYQQAFELVSKTLRYPVAAQNVVKRGDPSSFTDGHPPIAQVPEKSRPKTIKGFEDLPNAYKAAYANQVPGWGVIGAVLDNKTRNTIGHASVSHDLRIGRIVSEKNPQGITYLDFVSRVFDLFELLCVSQQVMRSVRIASSPDFGT